MKRSITAVALALACALAVPAAARPVLAAAGPVTVNAPAAIVMDSGTGQVIYEKNSDEKRAASTVVKTMSLLLFAQALEKGEWSLDTHVTVSANAAGLGGSTAFLDSGATYKVGDLLKAVCMNSSNDACMALAEKLAGTEEAFVERMNARAQELGLDVTFTDCTGLGDETKLSAKDIAAIARAAAGYSQILKYCDIWLDTLLHPGGRETELTNTNRLIRAYADCDGLQTGSNANAGYCMAATAKRSGMRLIVVVLGASDSTQRQKDATNLFEYAFANFSSVRVLRKGEIVQRNVPVENGLSEKTNAVSARDVTVLIPKGQEGAVTREVTLNASISAPVKAGAEIGSVDVMLNDNVLAKAPLTVPEDIEEDTFLYCIHAFLRDWIQLF
jgi:D-alanyl-D-alanine carboxypeptidase (penicillin-binding protein 5/6)